MSYRFNDAGIRASFYEVVDNAVPDWVSQVAWRVSSNTRQETYSLLGFPPALREWIGNKLAKSFREDTISIINKPWEATVEVFQEELRRGEFEQILVRIQELADRGLAHPRRMLTDFMVTNSETGAVVAYDGQNFFDTDHLTGDSGTQDNDLTGAAATGTTPTVAEMRDAIMSTIQAILGFKDDQGQPMNEMARNFLVMVPINYWAVGRSAVGLPTIDQGVTNVLATLEGFNIDLVANAMLPGGSGAWGDQFATFRTDGRVKPFILQEEVPLALDNLSEGSDTTFMNRNHLYSATWWGNVHFGMWQQACLWTFT